MKKETFTIKVLNSNISIKHSGNKYFREQKNGMSDLKSYLSEAIQKGEKKGFVPYNNFECSFNWEVKDEPEPNKEYLLTGGPGVKCILNGNTWAESEVKETEPSGFDKIDHLEKQMLLNQQMEDN